MSVEEKTLINGHEFNRYDESLWARNNHAGDVKTDDHPDVVCPCGNQTFTLRYGNYEITARCAACGIEEVVYDG